MNKIQRELYRYCFQCGGEADWKVAGDSWCWKCDAAAHYAMGLQSVNDEVAKAWTPDWLISEFLRMKQAMQEAHELTVNLLKVKPTAETTGIDLWHGISHELMAIRDLNRVR